MGIIVTVGATTKGGTGKSTVCTNVAVDLDRQGYANVKVFDTDVENTASGDFFRNRLFESSKHIDCSTVYDAEDLEKAIEFANSGKDHVAIIDVAGLESNVTAAAVAISDILFIPFRMSSKDLTAMGSFLEKIKEAKSNGATMKTYLIPNYLYANSNPENVKRDIAPLLDIEGIEYGTALKNRNSYIDSADSGQSVTEIGDAKAGAEIYPLVKIINERLNDEK